MRFLSLGVVIPVLVASRAAGVSDDLGVSGEPGDPVTMFPAAVVVWLSKDRTDTRRTRRSRVPLVSRVHASSNELAAEHQSSAPQLLQKLDGSTSTMIWFRSKRTILNADADARIVDPPGLRRPA